MKMRKKLAALLAAAMIASVMPMTAFAASTNEVTHPAGVTVKEDKGTDVPHLKIKLKHDLAAGQEFYLNLENAKWVEDVKDITTKSSVAAQKFTIVRNGSTELAIKATDEIKKDTEISIQLNTTNIKGEATVEVDSNDTVVTSGKYLFAKSSSTKAKAVVGDVSTFADIGDLAKITFDESYAKAFYNEDAKTVTVELNDDKFEFVGAKGATNGILEGKKAYAGKNLNPVVKNAQTLEINVPAGYYDASQRGSLELKDIKIAARKGAVEGDVEVYIEGYFFEDETLVVAKYGDFTTALKTKEVKDYTAGKRETVKFTLEEVAGGAINTNRRTTFTFSDDIVIHNVKKHGDVDSKKVDIDADDKNIFTIEDFQNDAGKSIIKDKKVEFEVEINIPAKFEGDLLVTAEGRSLDATKELKLAEVKAPVTVKVEAMKVAVGTKENKGGKITITETDKKNINRGTLVIQLPKDLQDDGVEFTKVKDLVLETTGGIKVDEAKYNSTTSAIEIAVTRQSTEAGSIEISGFEVKARRTIADGAYEIEIGGTAISSDKVANLALNKDKDGYVNLDAITSADFILVGDRLTKAEVVFTIGSNKFLVDGKEVEMDAAAYIKDGRTMVPVRYLATALGIDTESIKFSAGVVTIFDNARVIQLQTGSKNLVINGMTIPMVAAAEIVEGRTYVPVTEIGSVFGVTGTWDPATQTATFK